MQNEIFSDLLLQTMQEPFLVLDGELRIKNANPPFYEMFHARAENTLGRLVFDCGEGRLDMPALHELLENILTAQPVKLEAEQNPKVNGPRKVFCFNVVKHIEADGKEVIFMAIKDVTLNKQAEKEFQKFIYAVAHDLQQPLSKIITISELLAEKSSALGQADKDYLARIHESGKRMKTLIDELANRQASSLKNP